MVKVFFWRKIHSLSGIIPLGVFIMVHMFINSMAVLGSDNFNGGVALLHSLPYLWFWELVLIFLPIVYHAGYGLWLVWQTNNNIRSYPYFRNGLFYWQRVSAIITLLFVTWHVAVLRFSEGIISSISFELVMKALNQPILLALYVIGLLATFSHFANGLWSFLVSWGITVGEQAQRTAGYCCFGVFIILTAVGLNALLAFV
ncbi:succinate dehydrogenase/fumarate reductase cytochrome b subunit, b558 family [Desulfosporosinus orientis DSM 765]|uniref:Succinate dehydrogenase/fumarate reductase cytochrome b subunit, b558 family n=1 Tax=Desulfosporosinus orientis (strain ATCC 19365 / DSM 765 / NCIMB 8382 / VKM B-1628 / Singapore I) TaxID=768706 RepID=G7WEY6_DESOD|nr:succinate dehydrogenase cytochrome B558 [Desulfosporosinus orientis]AET67315.1 succinate dehydrogenase/fumarate reductase cytochrome b subunit, b558 family [Desulfosporosinus orientis DSM 765]